MLRVALVGIRLVQDVNLDTFLLVLCCQRILNSVSSCVYYGSDLGFPAFSSYTLCLRPVRQSSSPTYLSLPFRTLLVLHLLIAFLPMTGGSLVLCLCKLGYNDTGFAS